MNEFAHKKSCKSRETRLLLKSSVPGAQTSGIALSFRISIKRVEPHSTYRSRIFPIYQSSLVEMASLYFSYFLATSNSILLLNSISFLSFLTLPSISAHIHPNIGQSRVEKRKTYGHINQCKRIVDKIL